MDTLIKILEIIAPIIIPVVLAVLAPVAKKWLDTMTEKVASQTENLTVKNAIYAVEEIIEACVKATNQTYVEALKKENAFTEDAQKEALTKTTTAILALITSGTKEIIANSVNDFTEWLNVKIEEAVNDYK